MERSKRSAAVSILGGFALATLIGCGGEESVASKSAAAYREAQKRGETFAGNGHAHGAAATDDNHAAPEVSARGEETVHGHAHGAAKEPSAQGGGMRHEGGHGGHPGMEHGEHPSAPREHGGHAAMEHAQRPTAPGGHAGHGVTAPQTPSVAAPPAAGHAGHAPSPAAALPAPSAPAPVAVSPGQPTATLRPDPLDAPAATSQADAQRSAAMAGEMAGGHGAHGAGTYRQVDAGRGPAAQEEKKKDEHEEHQHEPPDLGGPARAERREG
jgi:hypothetical protein